MRVIATFDPTSGGGAGSFDTLSQLGGGSLYVWNESNSGLLFSPNSSPDQLPIPPWMGYPIRGWRRPTATINWSVDYTLNSAQPPISRVQIVLFDPEEPLPSAVPIPLPRQTNVGNQVSTTGTSNVINDGQAAPTVVVEATPASSAQSLLWNNDGSGKFGGGNDVVNAVGVFTAMAADAIPVGAIAAGALDTDVTLGAPQVTTGALPAGVTLPGPQVTGDLAANQIGPGALDADVTIAGAEVTGDLAANQIGPGALDVDVTVVGSQVTSAVAQANELAGGSFTTSDTSAFFAEILDTKNPAAVIRGMWFRVWNGAAQKLALTIGSGQGGSANIDDNGNVTTPGLTVNPTTPGVGKGVVVGTTTKGAVLQTDQGGSLELGAPNAANPGGAQNPYIDFHSSANPRDYDSRIIATGGGASDGLGRVALQHNGGNATLRNGSRFTGTGTGTFSHGLGTTPNHLDILAHVNGSQTQGYDAEGATTVHITSGGGLAWTAAATVL